MLLRTQLQTVVTTLTLLALAGSGCSDGGGGGNAQVAALCAQLDAKQGELDCKVEALKKNCAEGDAACVKAKDDALQACNTPKPLAGPDQSSTSSSTSTSTAAEAGVAQARSSACGGGAGQISTSTSTSSSTSTASEPSTMTPL